jgi:hypothetical protein
VNPPAIIGCALVAGILLGLAYVYVVQERYLSTFRGPIKPGSVTYANAEQRGIPFDIMAADPGAWAAIDKMGRATARQSAGDNSAPSRIPSTSEGEGA